MDAATGTAGRRAAKKLLALVLLALHLAAPSSAATTTTPEKLSKILDDIRGDDDRLVKWGALAHTAERRSSDGHCGDAMLSALDFLSAAGTSDSTKADACEYASFCMIDNPEQREVFSTKDSIYRMVVDVIKSSFSSSPGLSAAACRMVYVASFNNRENHQGFFHAGAVAALADVVKADGSRPVQVMWAAAALQNLAASYCEGSDDGRCSWNYDHGATDGYLAPQIQDFDLPVESDGTSARKVMWNDRELVDRLIALSCQGPTPPMRSQAGFPLPGGSMKAKSTGAHDGSPNIAVWAATAALRNIAIEPETHPYLDANALKCLCGHSLLAKDWLERQKAREAIKHLRPDSPVCHEAMLKDVERREMTICIDMRYMDRNGYNCGEVVDDGEEKDFEGCGKELGPNTLLNEDGVKDDKLTPRKACCACGGGIKHEARIASYPGLEGAAADDEEDDPYDDDDEDYEDDDDIDDFDMSEFVDDDDLDDDEEEEWDSDDDDDDFVRDEL